MRLNKFYCVAVLGGVLAAVGAIFALFWGDILDAIIVKEKSLTPTSKTFKLWKRPPFDVQWQITLFNWTNAAAFLANQTEKPAFNEVGPFAYTESQEKLDIRFNTKNSTISFRKRTFFSPDEARTNASLDEIITSINMVANSAGHRAQYMGYAPRRAASFALHSFNQEIVIRKTASELLFEGYPERMLNSAEAILSLLGEETVDFNGRFSWFHLVNGTKKTYGFFNMDTGKDDSSQYGMIRMWNYKSQADFADAECGKYRGFMGELLPTKIRKDRPLLLFNPEVCRTLTFEFDREEEVHGVKGYRFIGTERTMDNGTLYAENRCYPNSGFLPSGVLNSSECRMGAPFYPSFPHFYLADPYYRQHIDGMNPDQERHQPFVTIEPTTGIAMNATVSIQINTLLQELDGIAMYQDVRRTYVPVLWFTRKYTMSEEDAIRLRSLVEVHGLGYVGGFAVMAAGLLMAVVAIVMALIFKATSKRGVKSPAPQTNPSRNSRGEYQVVQNDQYDKERIK